MNKSQDYSPGSIDTGKKTDNAVCIRVCAVPPDCAGLRLDQALARLFSQYSRSRLQAWLREGLIRVEGKVLDAKAKVYGGERLEWDCLPDTAGGLDEAIAENIPLSVVFEDDTLLVLDKPAGLVVHPGSGNLRGTLMNALLHHAPQLAGVPRAGIVHRLDKDTSGLLVVAKTLAAQTHLIRQLQARTVSRRYLALLHGGLARGGEVAAPIARHPVHRTKMAVAEGGRAAHTRYEVRERLGAATLVECRLETGRTHQIRVHMAHIGHPLVGDPVYGLRHVSNPVLASFGRQALHAFRLGLVHPLSGEPMCWFSPLPEDFSTILRQLGSSGVDSGDVNDD